MTDPSTLKRGDILLFYRARGINRFITLVTKSPFYHVAISLGGELIVEARPKGVEKNDLRKRRGGEIFTRIPAPGTDDEADNAARWTISKVGDGYDAAGVVAMVLDRAFVQLHVNKVVGDRYSCGEFVALAYRQAGRDLFPDIEAEDVAPGDFARLLPAGPKDGSLSG
ncbi:MAG TPA: hypothetical protein VJN22_01370 [Candidatus Eremiobacteraceae bacterium]|nr:hypothetical protein [Candidatus Eremiobacteraceae bacterium]